MGKKKLPKIIEEIMELQKDPKFRKNIREFIKATTR
jgi:hypothetical protein